MSDEVLGDRFRRPQIPSKNADRWKSAARLMRVPDQNADRIAALEMLSDEGASDKARGPGHGYIHLNLLRVDFSRLFNADTVHSLEKIRLNCDKNL
jgi:hypothetical protein